MNCQPFCRFFQGSVIKVHTEIKLSETPSDRLIEIVEEVLETGLLPMSVEQKMYTLLHTNEIDETEMAMIDQLIEALTNGDINAIA